MSINAEQALQRSIALRGETVSLQLRGQEPVSIKALIGSTEFAQEASSPGEVPLVISKTTDFLVDLATTPTITRTTLLTFNGQRFRPVATNSEPVIRDCGRHGLCGRIHTVRVK